MAKKLKIGFDARMIEHSGIGVRIQHILEFWPFSSTDIELHLFGDVQILKNYSLPHNCILHSYRAKVYSIRELFGHWKMIDLDILDVPHFNVALPFLRKTIVTVHDLIPFHFKEAHSSLFKRVYLQVIFFLIKNFSKQIQTVSEFTKNDLVSTFFFSPERIQTVYNGISLDLFSAKSDALIQNFRKQYNLPETFLLLVGIDKPHKNLPFVFLNLEELWLSQKTKIPIVIAGTNGKISPSLQKFRESFPDFVIILPRIPYSDLSTLYQSATLLVYPSLWEGFGFPGLEAQASGLPVLASNRSALPEVLKSSAAYFDPENSENFQKELLSLLGNEKKRRDLAISGKKNAKDWAWSRVLQDYRSLYNI